MKLLFSLFISFLLIGSLGCNKKDLLKEPDAGIDVIINTIKSQEKIFQYSEKAKLLLNNLNRKLSFSLDLGNDKIYFVKISGSSEKYLAIYQSKTAIKTGGVYKIIGNGTATSKVLTDYFLQRKIPVGNAIEIFNLEETTTAKIEGLPGGHIKEAVRLGYKSSNGNLGNGIIETKSSSEPDPYGVPPVCTDWYLTTYVDGVFLYEEYVGTTCESSSSGNGGPASYAEGSSADADDGKLSCRSFSFTNITGNAYEAGVSGLQFSFSVYGTSITKTFSFRDIFVNFPKTLTSGQTYSPGDAAALTAKAFNRAALSMALQYQFYTLAQASSLTTSIIENQFKNLVSIILSTEIGASAEAYFIQQGQNTIIKSAEWNSGWQILWNGLTGSGCKGQ